jgi:hypothetical protein
MPKLESLDIETKVHDLRNTVKVLSCVVGYSLEHPEGPQQRSGHNLDVARYSVDASVLLTAMDRVADLSDDLYSMVCDPSSKGRPERPHAEQVLVKEDGAALETARSTKVVRVLAAWKRGPNDRREDQNKMLQVLDDIQRAGAKNSQRLSDAMPALF